MSSLKDFTRRGLTHLLRRLDGEPPEPAQISEGKPAPRADHAHANDYKRSLGRWERVEAFTKAALTKAQVSNGTMLEIGGRVNPRKESFKSFDYFALDLADHPKGNVPVQVGDITDCKHIPDGSYDFIFSLDVFEHIHHPFKAGSEITRLLKPGGVTVHSTLFSWRYHPCPGDYFRYTPEGLKALFPDLDCLDAQFDYTERRRNIIGKDGNRMEPDELGGWRENVRVNYAGMKR